MNVLVLSVLLGVAVASASDFTLSVDWESGTHLSPPTPADFASFSYEVPCAPLMFSEKNGSAAACAGNNCPHHHVVNPAGPWAVKKSYVNLLNILRTASAPEGSKTGRGPNIRIGGNSADATWFTTLPDEKRPTGDYNSVSVQDIATYNYASLWNGTVVVDINIRQMYNTTNSVEYAVAALELMDPAVLVGFEVGNEPDLFGQNGIRNKSWTFDGYNQEFQRYVDAMQQKGKIPMPFIQGAVFACCWGEYIDQYTQQWTTPGSVGTSNQNVLRTVSQHHYPMAGKGATIAKLMERKYAADVAAWASNANFVRERGIPFLIGEGNSAYNGGAWGVSNTMAAALWSIDTLSFAATANISRWNFHGCPQGAYTPIALDDGGHAVARPLFYGMWFFSRFTRDEARFIPSTLSPPQSNSTEVVAWATLTKGGALRVALLQKTVENPTTVSVSVHIGKQLSGVGGIVIRLEAPSLSEEDNLTFAHQTLNNVTDGKPAGFFQFESVSVDTDGNVEVHVPPASAALLEIQV